MRRSTNLFISVAPSSLPADDELDDLLPSVLATGGRGELDREGQMIDSSTMEKSTSSCITDFGQKMNSEKS